MPSTLLPAGGGERLHNNIELPACWPPAAANADDWSPQPVPYLAAPPSLITIDVGRQLFVDDFLIEETTLQRVFGMPQKHAANPVLVPTTPLEINAKGNSATVPKGGGLWWDPYERLFKLWYEAGWLNTICYATSRDGIAWERPLLDVVPGTNQVLPPGIEPDSWSVVPDWETSNPLERYKMFLREPGGWMEGWCFTSADGIHWDKRTKTGQVGDRTTLFYNPFRRKWVYSLRTRWRGRARSYWEHDDFLAGALWEGDKLPHWLAVDECDMRQPQGRRTPQLYNFDAVAYESLMLGAFEIHHGPENPECEAAGLPKITELNFAYSRDGYHWSRPDRRPQIRAEGWDNDKWDRGYVQSLSNLCVINHDQLWFYYSAFRGDPARNDGGLYCNGMYHHGAMGVATLRRDGFAAMVATGTPGQLTTRPLLCSGSHLFVNLDAPAGELRVELLDAASNTPLPGFTADDCLPLRGDATAAPVVWRHHPSLAPWRGRPLRLRFTLTNGALYAFWISRAANGRSDGYLAGGGPGYSGPTDTVGHTSFFDRCELTGSPFRSTNVER